MWTDSPLYKHKLENIRWSRIRVTWIPAWH